MQMPRLAVPSVISKAQREIDPKNLDARNGMASSTRPAIVSAAIRRCRFKVCQRLLSIRTSPEKKRGHVP